MHGETQASEASHFHFFAKICDLQKSIGDKTADRLNINAAEINLFAFIPIINEFSVKRSSVLLGSYRILLMSGDFPGSQGFQSLLFAKVLENILAN